MAEWCVDNNLVLNITKTKNIPVDFMRSKRTKQTPLTINGEEVERVDSVQFLGTNITKDLTWATNISNLVKRAQKRLFFLLKLKQAGLSSHRSLTLIGAQLRASSARAAVCGMQAAQRRAGGTWPGWLGQQ